MAAYRNGIGHRTRAIPRSLGTITLFAVLVSAPSVSASDPVHTVTIDPSVRFVEGSTLEYASAHCNNAVDGCCGEFYDTDAEFDAALDGLAPESSWSVMGIGTPGTIATGEVRAADVGIHLNHPYVATSYEGTCGGGSITLYQWEVEVVAPGNPSTRTVATAIASFDVFDEDGADLAWNRADAEITTRGSWRTSACDCWVDGTVLRTRRPKARLHFTTEVEQDEVLAVVMTTAPNRGQARILLDGVNEGRIDTYSAVRRDRIVVWQTPPLDAGFHTITVVNLATEGRPRIDVDAFLAGVGQGSTWVTNAES